LIASGIYCLVTTGPDPVVHTKVPLAMDCRVKPGNDAFI
jgi:hypothetical protein